MSDVQMADAETFYSNEEIILRKLMSNSSDVCLSLSLSLSLSFFLSLFLFLLDEN